MENGANPFGALLAFWMLLQLGVVLMLVIGGISLMMSFSRAARSLERLATAVETMARRPAAEASPGVTPPASPPSAPPASPYTPAAPATNPSAETNLSSHDLS